jgi:hypothetical protein
MSPTFRAIALASLLWGVSCRGKEPSQVISRDESTPLGVTAGEVVAMAEGTSAGKLTWKSPPDLNMPVSGLTSMTVGIDCAGGESRLVGETYEQRIEIDCSATVVTGDGGLNESWSITVSASSNAGVLGVGAGTGKVEQAKVNGTVRSILYPSPDGTKYLRFSVGTCVGTDRTGEIDWSEDVSARNVNVSGPVATFSVSPTQQ